MGNIDHLDRYLCSVVHVYLYGEGGGGEYWNIDRGNKIKKTHSRHPLHQHVEEKRFITNRPVY